MLINANANARQKSLALRKCVYAAKSLAAVKDAWLGVKLIGTVFEVAGKIIAIQILAVQSKSFV